MKESMIKDTTIRINNMGNEKLLGKVFECNVNMSVSLSNAKRSRIYQRIHSLLIVILTVIFFIFYTQIKRELRALETQMNSVNSNFAILMIKYEKLHENLHDINWQQNIMKKIINRSMSKYDDRTSHHKDPVIKYNYDSSNVALKSHNEILKKGFLNYIKHNNKHYSNTNLQRNKKLISDVNNTNSAVISDDNKYYDGTVNYTKQRVARSVVMKNTYEENKEIESMTNSMIEKDDKYNNNNNNNNSDEMIMDIGESRTGRARRDDGRGKGLGGKNKRRPPIKCSRRRLGPITATFVGAEPEQHVTDTVYIGPWVKRNETRYGFNKFHLVEDKRSIEVTVNGLFMVSVQIYYFGEQTQYSYWILLTSEGESLTKKIGKCATASANYAAEASCFTSVIVPLRRGDRLHIQQQERDRFINLREGYSFIQLTLLSNEQQKKRIVN